MDANSYHKYNEDFKKSLVPLHQYGKTKTQLCEEYGVSKSTLGKWIKQYFTVEMDDGDVLTTKRVKNCKSATPSYRGKTLSKKVIFIFTPHSNND